MLAAMYSQADCIKILLGAGAERGAKDEDGKTAYDLISVIHGTPEIRKWLRHGSGT